MAGRLLVDRQLVNYLDCCDCCKLDCKAGALFFLTRGSPPTPATVTREGERTANAGGAAATRLSPGGKRQREAAAPRAEKQDRRPATRRRNDKGKKRHD